MNSGHFDYDHHNNSRPATVNGSHIYSDHAVLVVRSYNCIKTKTNVYCKYGSQEAGLVKHKLHPMNSIAIWYNKTRDTKYTL